ncbi:MAG TPA: S41 family peptidase [Thermoleophilaceae bacterium]|nr:S41 family peptidase [Thermoleophilaceae bacterium]
MSAVIALAVGLWLGGHPGDLPGPIRDTFVKEDRAVRAEIIDAIEGSFYKPVKESKLEDASLKGIVESLDDPYSSYLTAKEARQFEEDVSGHFEGVGMNVEQDRRGLKVLRVFEGSPAQDAHIHAGDFILAVNGRPIAGVNSEVSTNRIKGPAGTTVELRVFTPGEDSDRTVKVKRERIEVPLTRARMKERGGRKIGVVELAAFSEGAHAALARDIKRLRARGADGIVLDLRGNPGGLLLEGVAVSSLFIEDGRIVSVRGRHRSERVHNAEGDAILPKDVPVAVLVDGGSASASEIVTGALRDRHRATVVGTHTFGKGLVQEVESLSNGGELKLTTAHYYLPDGETIITGKGIKPQVRAKDDPKTDRDEALPVALDTVAGEL